jgi:hypothetical protein
MSTPQPPHASPSPHLDVDALADLQAELLDADQVTAAAAHLADCAQCRSTRDALDDVRLLLRDHGDESSGAAPDDVVRRLDDALAAAGPRVATASATVIPLTMPARSPWRTRGLQAAAVFVLVAAVGGLGYGGIRALNNRDSSTTDSGAASAGGAQTEKRAARYSITNSGRDYTQASLLAALPELLAGSLPAADGATLGATKVPNPAAAPGSSAPPTASSSGSAASPDPERLRSGPALAACVTNLGGGHLTPLAVDLGRFEGKPATIIVLPDPDDASFVNVYAVAPDCPTGTFLTWQHVALP